MGVYGDNGIWNYGCQLSAVMKTVSIAADCRMIEIQLPGQMTGDSENYSGGQSVKRKAGIFRLFRFLWVSSGSGSF